MSATTEIHDRDLREQIARIDRAQEETRKFVAEQHKLIAEQLKLAAEAKKLDRDRFLAPLAMVVSAMAAGGALVGGTVALMKLLGQ
ncbi:hypothetical protein [Rhodopila sp.]|jgi:hypothetical protein|uniref:hypothetical protein n=1 Tax=Rhodopila sp. TaxID=2480087 RepID=UPI002C75D9CF|nr:hypothetical protein [Rhodopila sp.]HVZ07203.1 hypothetical protein [Rhodopila sp.]